MQEFLTAELFDGSGHLKGNYELTVHIIYQETESTLGSVSFSMFKSLTSLNSLKNIT